MIIIENRPVKVVFCDFCRQETKNSSKCNVCGRDMCMDDGGKKHVAYSLEIYRYCDSKRIVSGHVCYECAGKNSGLTTGELLNLMLDPSPAAGRLKDKDCDYLLELVVSLGFVTAEQVAEARADAKPEQGIMGVLLEKKLITQGQIAAAKAAQFGAKVIVLRDMIISSLSIGLILPSLAWRYRVIPVEKVEDRVVIAIDDPSDLNTIDTLTHLLNAEIEIRVAAEDDMEEALKKYYPDGEENGKKLREESKAI